jgi:hypothetical protein
MAAPPIAAPQRKRRRQQQAIPAALRKEIALHAREIGKKYGKLFSEDRSLKQRVVRLMAVLLPPRRRRGRPRDPQITQAIGLHSKLCRQYPAEKAGQIWDRVCRVLCSEYARLSEIDQRDIRDTVRGRVKSRARSRRVRKSR